MARFVMISCLPSTDNIQFIGALWQRIEKLEMQASSNYRWRQAGSLGSCRLQRLWRTALTQPQSWPSLWEKAFLKKRSLLLIEVVRLHLAFNGLAAESHQAQIRWRFPRNTQCLSFHCNQKMNNKQKYFYFASHRWIERSNPNSQ